MESKGKSYKSCFVPLCKSTSISTPCKIFLTVPRGKSRKKWFKIVRREPTSLTSYLTICEDHFNVEEDTENWIRYKLSKQVNLPCTLKLEPNVLPHKFDCQPNRKRTHTINKEPLPAKRRRKIIVKDLLESGPSIKPIQHLDNKVNKRPLPAKHRKMNIVKDLLESGPSIKPIRHLDNKVNKRPLPAKHRRMNIVNDLLESGPSIQPILQLDNKEQDIPDPGPASHPTGTSDLQIKVENILKYGNEQEMPDTGLISYLEISDHQIKVENSGKFANRSNQHPWSVDHSYYCKK